MKIKIIAVFGSSGITQESTEAQQAYEIGKLLAQSNYIIINGGYMGAMEACGRGAKEAGGEVIGVACKAFTDRTPNSYSTEVIWTDNLPQRIATLMDKADAYVVLDGNIGTIAELLLAWNIKAMGGTKPVIVVGEKLKECVYNLIHHTEISEKQIQLLEFADNVKSVVSILEKYQ